MNFDNWTPHAHYMGLLMTNPKGKSNLQKHDEAVVLRKQKKSEYDALANKETKTAGSLLSKVVELDREIERLKPLIDIPVLSETCKTKLKQIYTEETTGRKKMIQSKYLEKGLMVEEDSITAYSVYTGNFHKKNEVTENNGWVTGTMDFEWEDEAIDTKSSWDIYTFDNARLSNINPIYEWQLHTYMWLYKKAKAKLVYCLINTPEHLIRAEEAKMMYSLFGNEMNMKHAPVYMLEAFEDAKREIRKNSIFDDLPLERKIKVFEIERVESKIELMKKRILECRWYLNNLECMRYINNNENIEDENEP